MTAPDRNLYRACEADLRALMRAGTADGVVVRDADDVCALLEHRLGVVIHRYPASLGGHPYGLVLRGRDFCIVLYERHTSAWHQEGIILHECGHIFYDHRGTEDGTTAALRVLIPDLAEGQLETIRRTGDAEGHRPEDERQAEAFATVGLALLDRMGARRRGVLTPSPTTAPPDDPAVAAAVRRLLDDFAGG
jgi:hypothetical protein